MTKTLEFKNDELIGIGNFLGNLKLKNMASLGRSKLIKLIVAKNKEFQDDLNEIRDQFFIKDDDGQFKVENEKLVYKDKSQKDEANKQVNALDNEKAVIEITEYSSKLKKLYTALQNYDEEFSNQDAVAYDIVMEAFEDAFDNQGKEE